MRLKITHSTHYKYGTPASYALQQLRLRPPTNRAQTVLSWELDLEGASPQVQFADQFGNQVDLILSDHETDKLTISLHGEVETHSTDGITGFHTDILPIWFYKRQTRLTACGKHIAKLVEDIGPVAPDQIDALHKLSEHIGELVTYEIGHTDTLTTAETALKKGRGVCQDHSHIFISAARELGFPARYVSGYLMMNDRVDQNASHAWAEAYIENLGWVAFDVSNGISPDDRYVQIARGLDYSDAAPCSGLTIGGAEENMIVSIQVQQ